MLDPNQTTLLRATSFGSVVLVKVNSLVCMSPAALVLMQPWPPLLLRQNWWLLSCLIVVMAESVEVAFLHLPRRAG
ncbi:hypothetical protein ACWD6N_31720 [Micromonospora sp. NPDC005163]